MKFKSIVFQASSDGMTYFVKVHAPMASLYKGAELMHMKMPIKVIPIKYINILKIRESSRRGKRNQLQDTEPFEELAIKPEFLAI